MILSEISTVLKNNSSADHITQQELKSLVEQYPFSSTLRLLQASKDLESEVFDQSNNRNLATYTATSHTVIDTLFSVTETQIQKDTTEETQNEIAESNIVENADVHETEHLGVNATGYEKDNVIPDENLNANVRDAENVDLVDNENVDIGENENVAIHVLEDTVDNDLDLAEDAVAMKTTIPELNHLSDYSSWLLQLKQPKQSKQSQQTIQTQQAQQSPQSQQTPSQQNTTPKTDKSSELNKEIVSESLAKLLAEQGHSKKATDMYRKLSLIIPEKSAYFAAQIEKIKGK